MHQSFETPGPTWPRIAELKCRDLTSDESRQCLYVPGHYENTPIQIY